MREDSGTSQTLKAILGLRGMIIDGELRPGERVLEQTLVDRLGVSRTPARTALVRVCEQGLLEAPPGSSGYAVARFSEDDVFDAIAIRGTLEGMAARMAAERAAPPRVLSALQRCVAQLDEVVESLGTQHDLTDYVRLNDEFHDLLVEASQSPMLRRSLERIVSLPFAEPNAFVSASSGGHEGVRRVLQVSQEQHRSIVDAIERREGSRAEALAREHSRSAWKYLRLMFDAGHALTVPGLALVDRAAPG